MKLVDWLDIHFQISNRTHSEVQITCPRCGHPNFYFNLKKKLGYCHRDRCHFSPKLSELVRIIGYGPDDQQSWMDREVQDTRIRAVELPDGAESLVFYQGTTLVTKYPIVSQKVTERGVAPEAQFHFDFKFDGDRLYIPVYMDGMLVQYVGRAFWWPQDVDHKYRYKYASGQSITKFIFNWDNAKNWNRLSLVENTFNGIWLRDHCFTSNFGSHMSNDQARLIYRGKAESVALLWDEGAESSAYKAVQKLKELGIAAAAARLPGQPDDFPEDYIIQTAHETHEAALRGELWLSPKTPL